MSANKEDELKRRAVEEILAETRRIVARVEDGTGTWHKPKFNGFNKRFLNNTVVATVSNNCRLDKSKPLFKFPSAEEEKPTKELPTRNFQQKKFNPKIKVNSKSRFQAYLAAKKRESKKAEEVKEEESSQNTEEIIKQSEEILLQTEVLKETKEENLPISCPKNHPIANWAEDSDKNSSSDQSD